MPTDASARVTGANGNLTRSRGISRCFREGAGNYHLIMPAGRGLRADEYHFDVSIIGAGARLHTLGNAGGAAPPGGANPQPGETSLQVLTFNAAGEAADADFLFSAERL